MDDDVVMTETHTSNGQALPYTNETRVTFQKGDTVVRNEGEYATVTYISPTHDYAEMTYVSTGNAFRTTASEWRRVEQNNTCDPHRN